MFQEERHQEILKAIKEKSSTTVNSLSQLFNVSEVTIRRDLQQLEDLNLIKRTHGGAILLSEPQAGLSFDFLLTQNTEEKKKIGRAAAQLVKEGETIFLESSTTVIHIARNLSSFSNLTVVTNSPHIILELSQVNKSIKIISLAGRLNPETMGVNGDLAEQTLSGMNIDRAFLGISAIDSELQVSSYLIEDAKLEQLIINRSRETIGVADHTKFDKKYFAPVTGANVFSKFIIDDKVSKEYVEKLKNANINLIVV